MRHLWSVYICLGLLTAALAVSCATAPQPRPVGNLSAEQLKAMLERKETLVLVDTRTEYEYRKGHIPRSVNIPPHKFQVIGTLLPSDKSVHLVFYCRGSS
jgi:predicted sulfurtransferase